MDNNLKGRRSSCRRSIRQWPTILTLTVIGSVALGQRGFAQDFLPGDSERLVHLNIAYRHGDRAPVTLYPKDPNNASFWRRGLGELTKEGCRMQYKLGSFLRAHYSNFITGDPKEISVQSSDKDRCLDSASCHLAGMFRPLVGQRFLPGLPWQPVPVHTRPNDEDGLLAPGNGNCPAADHAYEQLKKTPQAQAVIKKYVEFYRNLTEWTGQNVTDWDTAGQIYDVVMIEQLYGLPVPQWAMDRFADLEYQQDLSFVWYAKTPLLQRLRGGLLAKQILGNMKKKAGLMEDDSGDVRVHMYSTHDTEIASLLELYELFDGKSPKYCSTVIVELWQDLSSANAKNFTVKIQRLNCVNMNPREVYRGSLSDFEAKIASKLPVDWDNECGRPPAFVPAAVFAGIHGGENSHLNDDDDVPIRNSDLPSVADALHKHPKLTRTNRLSYKHAYVALHDNPSSKKSADVQ